MRPVLRAWHARAGVYLSKAAQPSDRLSDQQFKYLDLDPGPCIEERKEKKNLGHADFEKTFWRAFFQLGLYPLFVHQGYSGLTDLVKLQGTEPPNERVLSRAYFWTRQLFAVAEKRQATRYQFRLGTNKA